MKYDSVRAAAFYDAYGEREWARFDDGRSSPTSPDIHAHYLRRFIGPGDSVLDVGAGPGRFTIELVRIGARVVVADVSAVQLELNRARLTEAGLAGSVTDWIQADIVDLHAFPDSAFDAVVCFGGPLSYVLEQADKAVDELLRVLRPGGALLVSVMSLVGATAAGLPAVIHDLREHGQAAVDGVIRTGDLPTRLSGHLPMHMYRWSELETLLGRHACTIVAASASALTFGRLHSELLASLSDEERALLIDWEIDLAAEPGAISSGEHMIAVARKSPL